MTSDEFLEKAIIAGAGVLVTRFASKNLKWAVFVAAGYYVYRKQQEAKNVPTMGTGPGYRLDIDYTQMMREAMPQAAPVTQAVLGSLAQSLGQMIFK